MMNDKNRKLGKVIYDELSKTMTDEEIADAYLLPSDRTESERKVLHDEFLKLRMEQLANLSEADILVGELMRMKVQVLKYVAEGEYSHDFSFGNQLKRYLQITRRSQKEFSGEVSIHTTTLNRVINGKEKPSIDLMYRLEKHSDKIISASLWFKLHVIKLESEIKLDKSERKIQYKKVERTFKFGHTA